MGAGLRGRKRVVRYVEKLCMYGVVVVQVHVYRDMRTRMAQK